MTAPESVAGRAAVTAADYWENRYATNGRSWSGRVNAALEREVGGLRPGTALDLGSGEGGDALWLARRGWAVTAVDIAPTALAIGAASEGPGDDVTWVAADLATWHPPRSYDLVTSCFLHSTVELPRGAILRRAAEAVAPGGVLLIVGHAAVPEWAVREGEHDDAAPEHSAQEHSAHEHAAHEHAPHEHAAHEHAAHQHANVELPTPQQVLAELFADNPRLSRDDWTVLTDSLIDRAFIAPDGTTGTIADSVLMLRRADAPAPPHHAQAG